MRSKVLLVLATSWGGVGRHVAQLAAGLAGTAPGTDGAGFQVAVAGPPDAGRTFGFPLPGTTFAPVGISDRPRPLADGSAVHRLRALAAAADVVHAHGLRAGALVVLAVRSLPTSRRPKIVVTLHNALVSRGRTAAVHAALERIVAQGCDVVLVVSADLRERMSARGAQDVRTAVVPAPALPPAQRGPDQVRAELGVPDGTPLLVTVARLAPQKGLTVLIDAVHLLGTQGLAVQAVVAGEGPLAASLVAHAQAKQVPVRLIGPRDDVADLLAAADLVVVPSLWEGQPLIVHEALLAGAAIVATDAGGTAELTQDAAVLVPPSDPQALATAIAALLRDPAERDRLRRLALARAESLPSQDDAVQQVADIYRGILC